MERVRGSGGSFCCFPTRGGQFSALSGLLFPSLIILALMGSVCALYKQQNEGDCLSSMVYCYQCDSREDPNCADPFDFSPAATLEYAKAQQANETAALEVQNRTIQIESSSSFTTAPNNTGTVANSTIPQRYLKKLPPIGLCHGCCVKITSKLPDGGVYVKRTCIMNLQINLFMVGLVCMKESGDRGKMCFCETDYCNGQLSSLRPPSTGLVVLLIILSSLLLLRLR